MQWPPDWFPVGEPGKLEQTSLSADVLREKIAAFVFCVDPMVFPQVQSILISQDSQLSLSHVLHLETVSGLSL